MSLTRRVRKVDRQLNAFLLARFSNWLDSLSADQRIAFFREGNARLQAAGKLPPGDVFTMNADEQRNFRKGVVALVGDPEANRIVYREWMRARSEPSEPST